MSSSFKLAKIGARNTRAVCKQSPNRRSPTVVLTIKRKLLILEHRKIHNQTGLGSVHPVGSNHWKISLHEYMHSKDADVSMQDIHRWCKTHPWIRSVSDVPPGMFKHLDSNLAVANRHELNNDGLVECRNSNPNPSINAPAYLLENERPNYQPNGQSVQNGNQFLFQIPSGSQNLDPQEIMSVPIHAATAVSAETPFLSPPASVEYEQNCESRNSESVYAQAPFPNRSDSRFPDQMAERFIENNDGNSGSISNPEYIFVLPFQNSSGNNNPVHPSAEQSQRTFQQPCENHKSPQSALPQQSDILDRFKEVTESVQGLNRVCRRYEPLHFLLNTINKMYSIVERNRRKRVMIINREQALIRAMKTEKIRSMKTQYVDVSTDESQTEDEGNSFEGLDLTTQPVVELTSEGNLNLF